ncbi:hypothetical protein [Streptomyces chromofuscus]|uniref:Uncharacterized protein n=1 Tax=Streptomyces chromofuscus TaxID=42881 RepID=A0A7M2T076_STRCW|nr:hypothetical protein [Streptomyces chromofuscus]QOV41962.1 hypothetical protein IPT68_18930 [Streptomyces chromofuscus]GGS86875.1 hypothetical protein GCM10010254_03350 [Streptomyces chromofuscus]
MARNLWIGKPGLLREMSQAAKSWDRSAELNVSEFKSLEGQITTVAPARSTRRLKFSWEWLEPADAQHLVRLARRVNGPGMQGDWQAAYGPVALLDPASVNLLDPYQAAAQSSLAGGADHWFTVTGAITISPFVGDVVLGDCQDPATRIGWRHGVWAGWPVMPGMQVSWMVPPDWNAGLCTAQLDWKDRDGAYLSSTSANASVVTGTAPAGAAFVTPIGGPGQIGITGLAGACLTIGEAPTAFALGDGCPAMAVTSFSDAPASRLPYRNISIDLVEVHGAAV